MQTLQTPGTQGPSLEAKLRQILETVRQRGYNLSCGADGLAARIAGPIPTPERGKQPRPDTGFVHNLVDEIGRELQSMFTDVEASLERADHAVGEFNPEAHSEAIGELGAAGRYARA